MIPSFDARKLRHIKAAPQPAQASERVLTRGDFDTAITEIRRWPGYAPTPLHRLARLADGLRIGGVRYKDEGPRFGLGSFKALGGAYAAARLLERELSRRLGREVELDEIRSGALATQTQAITLTSATDGNHGRSLAWGARMFGAPCRIYVHEDVSRGRVEAMQALDATVVVVNGDYDASVRICRDEAEANGWFVVSDTSWEGYTQPPRDVMAGYGVMTNEIVEAMVAPPSHVLLQGGVGGLAASVTAALRQRWGQAGPRIIIVEPELAACLYESAKIRRTTSVTITEETVMAGLSCGEPSALAWEILFEEASDFLTIPDEFVAPTMRLLANPLDGDPAIAAGESAVATLAALIAAAQQERWREALDLDETSVVLVVGSEGVTDPEIYRRILAGASR